MELLLPHYGIGDSRALVGGPMKKSVLLKLTVAVLSLMALIGHAQQLNAAQASPALKTRIADGYGKLPISFEANRGQASGRVKLLARGRRYGLYLTGQEAVLALHSSQPAKTGSGAELQELAHLPPSRRLGNRPLVFGLLAFNFRSDRAHLCSRFPFNPIAFVAH
jgi:hypothetical protein